MSWPSCMHALLTSIATSTTTPALEIANNRRRCPLPHGASSVGVLSSREEA
jgi:hypothetical protein